MGGNFPGGGGIFPEGIFLEPTSISPLKTYVDT